MRGPLKNAKSKECRHPLLPNHTNIDENAQNGKKMWEDGRGTILIVPKTLPHYIEVVTSAPELAMNVLIAGGSGLVGRAIAGTLRNNGHSVTILTRRPVFPGFPSIQWDAKSPGPWEDSIGQFDAVINLAGESLGAGRWTAQQKEKILSSRIDATNALVKAIGKSDRKPRVLLNASAIGYYGHVDEDEITETRPPGRDFLADVCVRWEDAAKQVMPYRTRLVVLRQGFVIGKDADAFRRMQLPFRLFVGGPYGSGKQWFSWAHITDVAAAYAFALEHPEISGPVNVASPNPVPVRELAKALGKILRRPSFMPAPSFALRIVLGEMSDLLLKGQRVIPKRLLEAGFSFRFSNLPEALRDVVS